MSHPFKKSEARFDPSSDEAFDGPSRGSHPDDYRRPIVPTLDGVGPRSTPHYVRPRERTNRGYDQPSQPPTTIKTGGPPRIPEQARLHVVRTPERPQDNHQQSESAPTQTATTHDDRRSPAIVSTSAPEERADQHNANVVLPEEIHATTGEAAPAPKPTPATKPREDTAAATAASKQSEALAAIEEEFFNYQELTPRPIGRTITAALLFACAVAVASLALEISDRAERYASYRTQHRMLLRVPLPPVVAPVAQPTPTRRAPRTTVHRAPAKRRPATPNFAWDRRLDAPTPGLGAPPHERIPALFPAPR